MLLFELCPGAKFIKFELCPGTKFKQKHLFELCPGAMFINSIRLSIRRHIICLWCMRLGVDVHLLPLPIAIAYVLMRTNMTINIHITIVDC